MQTQTEQLDQLVKDMGGKHLVVLVDFFIPIKTPLNKAQQYQLTILYVGDDMAIAHEEYTKHELASAEALIYLHKGQVSRLRSFDECCDMILEYYNQEALNDKAS